MKAPNNKDIKNAKTFGFLVLNFILLYAGFRIIVEMGERYENLWIYYIGTSVYAVAATVLAIAFYVLNGYKLSSELRTRDELPAAWDDGRKDDFLAKQPARAEKAKKLLLVIMPLAVVLLISFIELYYFS